MAERQIINIKDKNEFTDCTECGYDLRGTEVPKWQKKFSGDFTHFSKLKGLCLDSEFPEIVSHWQCPCCKSTFSRFS
jgi:hypothetical protein